VPIFLRRYHGADVAIKKSLAKTMNAAKRQLLRIEGETWSQIRQHPNICRLIGWVENENVMALVMEWVDNGSMLDVLQSKKFDFTLLDKMNILSKASAGLWHLHEQGFIHRDVALRNVLVDIRNFQVKLTDFGLSRITQTISDAGKTTSHVLPVAWTAPECISQNIYSPKSDVWSFGVLIWELMTERVPFQGENLMALSFKIATGKRTLEIPSSWLPELHDLTGLCWAFDPDERPTVEELHDGLILLESKSAGSMKRHMTINE